MRRIVFDIEANGFLEDLDRIHCLVAHDIDRKTWYRFYDGEIGEEYSREGDLPLKKIPILMNNATTWIGHNIIQYDIPALLRFYDLKRDVEIVDTFIWSKVLWPDRPMPRGCPPVILNPTTGKYDKIGPHSLAAWGYRVGRKKPEYFEWSDFDGPMLMRCESDVQINTDTYYHELKEAGLEG